MKLIFIHGPAACGKYTVGRALSEITGLPLFHNHLVVDAVRAVFDFASEPFVDLRERFWMEVFERAAREGRSLIFTFHPEASVAEDFPDRVVETIEAHGGEVIFIQLTCPEPVVEERLASPSRKSFDKLMDVELYRQLERDGAFRYPTLPHPRIEIDTSSVEPREAAARIAAAAEETSPIADR